MMKKNIIALLALLTSGHVVAENAVSADFVYRNAQVITMDKTNPNASGFAVKDGKFIAIGKDSDLDKYISDTTKVIDVQDKTIVPGFIDTHGHFAGMLQTLKYANLSPSPLGEVNSIDDVINEMKQFWANKPDADWYVGIGYDDSLLAEVRHPTRHDLDKIDNTRPVVILHSSFHLAVANTKALEVMGFKEGSPDPHGGKIVREAGTSIPNGVLEEHAIAQVMAKVMAPTRDFDDLVQEYKEAQSYYASFGITTTQEGAASMDQIKTYEKLAKTDALFLDIAAYPTWDVFSLLRRDGYAPTKEYTNGYRLAGIKLILDGAPQGRTAFMTKPYKTAPAGTPKGYKGYPTMEQDFLITKLGPYVKKGYQFIVHTNGDASVDMYLNALDAVTDDSIDLSTIRPVSIHSQTTRDDQLERMKEFEMIPSFFTAHTYFWGDWHNDVVFGEERARRISPTGSAERIGLMYTTHNDAPVIDPDVLRLIYNSVNRVTRSGKVLGPEQKATPYNALASVTINAAYQYFEETKKGSIEQGKLADFVVLSDNPLKVSPNLIKDVEVLQTVKSGKSIYKKEVDWQ
jgi:predicted amidohydrolase YtcJ